MSIFKKDVLKTAGPPQLCTGYQASCEVAVDSVAETFNEEVFIIVTLYPRYYLFKEVRN